MATDRVHAVYADLFVAVSRAVIPAVVSVSSFSNQIFRPSSNDLLLRNHLLIIIENIYSVVVRIK